MSDVMMALGSFQFGVRTAEYQSLKTSMSWRWAKKDRYGRKPAQQFHGADAATKSFEITIYPQNAADLGRYQQLKALADKGEPVRLVAGGAKWVNGSLVSSGADLGLWVIEKLDVDESLFMRDGTALEQKGSLQISEYGEDS
jgi:hypothetical protein